MLERVIVDFTEAYRDRHWRKCSSYGLDPRKCGRWELRGDKWFWTDGCYATRTRDNDGEFHNYCMRDDKACDAHFVE